MSVDPLTTVSSIQQLTSTFRNLGPELASAAPTGAFGSVLSNINTELETVAHGGVPPVSSLATAAGTPAVSTDTFLSSSAPSPSGEMAASSYPGPRTGAPSGEQVVTDAQRYLGIPYRWGGTDPATGLDCSGLVQRVYRDVGVELPRTSEEQANVGAPVSNLAAAQPGDLVFFAGSDGTASSPGHVGIYIGNGKMIDAPHTGTDVQVQDVGTPVSIRRILPAGYNPIPSAGLTAVEGGPGAAGSDPGMNRLGVPGQLQPLFEEAGRRYGIDPLLLASVARQESGFQTGVVSSAGAQGLMQLMPATAAGLGVNPTDPASAIDGAAQLLSSYLGSYRGSVPLALAAYNAGPGAVSQYGGVPPYGETQGYVANISSMLAQAQAQTAESGVAV